LGINWDNKDFHLFDRLDLFGVFDYQNYKKKWNAGFQTKNAWPTTEFSYGIATGQREDIGDTGSGRGVRGDVSAELVRTGEMETPRGVDSGEDVGMVSEVTCGGVVRGGERADAVPGDGEAASGVTGAGEAGVEGAETVDDEVEGAAARAARRERKSTAREEFCATSRGSFFGVSPHDTTYRGRKSGRKGP
jgi:hypothetical protein